MHCLPFNNLSKNQLTSFRDQRCHARQQRHKPGLLSRQRALCALLLFFMMAYMIRCCGGRMLVRPPIHGRVYSPRRHVTSAARSSARKGSLGAVKEPPTQYAPSKSSETLTWVDDAHATIGDSAEQLRAPWTKAEYQKLYRNHPQEDDYWITEVEGVIPTDIEGTFYRNGPGILELGGERMHCFDGHGLIARIGILNGQAHFCSRFVRTPVYEEEVRANKIMYRGFGSQKPGGILANFLDIRDKPTANTSLMELADGRLYALWEGHNPFRIDPDTLDTIGEENFDGALREAQPFTAHPCYDPHTGHMIAFSNGIRHAEGKLHIWELSSEGKIVKVVSHTTGMLPILYLHDFKVTKNWYVFHQAPLGFNAQNALRYFTGQCEQTQQVFFDGSRAGAWVLVPRDGGPIVRVPTEPQMIWHYANAFEDESTGKISVDACVLESFDFQFDMRDPNSAPVSEVARFTVDPKAGTSTRESVLALSADFPQINPAYAGNNYRYTYVASPENADEGFPFRRVVKLNMQTKRSSSWLAPPGCFVGEPIFIPRTKSAAGNDASVQREGRLNGQACDVSPVEDDGYIACLVSDARRERSTLAILDARRLEEGPLAQLHMRSLLPMAFHCLWSPASRVPAV